MCHTAKQFLLSTQIINEPITCTDRLPLQVFTITFGILQTTTTLEAYANKSEILYRVDNIALKLLRQTCNLRGLMWNQRQQGKGSKREVHGLTFFYFLEREKVGIFQKNAQEGNSSLDKSPGGLHHLKHMLPTTKPALAIWYAGPFLGELTVAGWGLMWLFAFSYRPVCNLEG